MATAAEKELAEIRKGGLEIIEVLQSYRNRRRILCYDQGAIMPWVIVGCGCGWYFPSEQTAREWNNQETARLQQRRAKNGRQEGSE